MIDEKLKTTINTIFEEFADKTIGQDAKFDYAQLQNAELPEQMKGFLLLELEFVARRALRSLQVPQFDFSSSLLIDERRRFAKQVLKTASLTRDVFLKSLQNAVVLQFHYLSTPQRVLTEIIFKEHGQEQAASEIQSRLAYFSDYLYLTDVFLKYLEKKKVEKISIDKFKKIVFDIDRKIIATYTEEDLLDLLFPLFNFFAIGGESEVPISILIGFLEEKDVQKTQNSLEDLAQKGIETLSLGDMTLILQDRAEEVLRNAIPVRPELSQQSLAAQVPPTAQAELSPLPEVQASKAAPAPPPVEPEVSTVQDLTEIEPSAPKNAEPEVLPETTSGESDFAEQQESRPQKLEPEILPASSAKSDFGEIQQPQPENIRREASPEKPSEPDVREEEKCKPPVFHESAPEPKGFAPTALAETPELQDDSIAKEVLAELSGEDTSPSRKTQGDTSSPEETLLVPAQDDEDSEFLLDDTNVPYEEKKEADHDTDLSILNKVKSSPPTPIPSSDPTNEMTDEFFKEVIGEGKPRATLSEPKPLPDLKTLIDESRRKRFIKKLFKGNEYEYDDAIAEINKKKNWREASVYIDTEVFERNKIDEYSSDAIYFTDIVFSRYN